MKVHWRFLFLLTFIAAFGLLGRVPWGKWFWALWRSFLP